MKKQTFYFAILIALLVLPISCEKDEYDDQNRLQSFKTEIAKSFVLGIAKGAGGKVGDEATGWVLENIFGESSEPSLSNEQLSEQINDIGTKLDNLSKQIERFKDDVDKTLQEIYVQGIRTEYTAQVSGLAKICANVKAIRNDFATLSTNASTTPTNDWNTLAKQINNELDIHTLETQLFQLQNTMTIGSIDGAIKLWGKLTFENITKSNADDCFLSVMNHFQRYYLVQADLLFFIIDKAHEEFTDHNYKAIPALAQYREEMLKQAIIFLDQSERMITYFASYMEDEFKFRDDWNLSQGASIKNVDSYQSDHLAFADELVGQAMGWENSITVRIVDQYVAGYSNIEDVSVTLVNVQTGAEYLAESSANAISKSYAVYPASIPTSYNWEVKRFIFNDLPNGSYKIKDTYAGLTDHFEGRNIKFLNDVYLSSPLKVSAGSHINIFCQVYAEVDE